MRGNGQGAATGEAAELSRDLAAIHEEYAEIGARLADPSVHRDHLLARRLRRCQEALRPLHEDALRLSALLGDLRDARELAEAEPGWGAEVRRIDGEAAVLRTALTSAVALRDRYDPYDVIVRVGGRAESGPFAHALLDLYRTRARERGWRAEILTRRPYALGVMAGEGGPGAWAEMKAENGLHVVSWREAHEADLPEIANGGAEGAPGEPRGAEQVVRVTVMPEPEPRPVVADDIRIDVYCTRPVRPESSVRIRHEPTGLVFFGTDAMSRKDKGNILRVLTAELAAREIGPDEPAARFLRHGGEPVARHRLGSARRRCDVSNFSRESRRR
ncbi:PCRF domain-containing protein [Actinomadura roseirufa]|uniref:PCRF domain-containing protein n=1 Tax=Actinomadura roseirufa TaxID=2094049 RepID=UPI0010416C54|nr:PCRF domain-containing protein [Actinomadura roseirufa]